MKKRPRTKNLPSHAPALLRKNPETGAKNIAEPFMALYRRARRCFWREVLKSPCIQSVWEAAMRPEWSPAGRNPIAHEDRLSEHRLSEDRLSKLISRSWAEARPETCRMGRFIEADPTLLDVHAGLSHTFDLQKGRRGPKRIALFNLRLWTSRALSRLWDRRWAGEVVALFGVKAGSVELKGLAPKSMLSARVGTSHEVPSQ